MSAPTTLSTRPPPAAPRTPADDGLGLLLDLFAAPFPAEVPVLRRADRQRIELRARGQEWLRRAANWGAGPQGAWRAW